MKGVDCMDIVKKHIKIKVNDDKEQLAIANSIHEQLVGNPDYIDNRIVLNIDVGGEVNLYIFDDCKEDPTIVI